MMNSMNELMVLWFILVQKELSSNVLNDFVFFFLQNLSLLTISLKKGIKVGDQRSRIVVYEKKI